MTPNNIVNMAIIKELDFIAVTDHNSAKNLPAVMAVATFFQDPPHLGSGAEL